MFNPKIAKMPNDGSVKLVEEQFCVTVVVPVHTVTT